MSSHESTSTLPAAQAQAARGFPVFPVSRQKRPLVSRNWHEIATCDGNQLRSWWNQFPEANPAIVADGLLVIDTDGLIAEELLASFPALPRTYTVRTARGHHRYFRRPPGVEVRNGQLGHHIDVKTDGGYIVAAGAIHASGVVYKIVDDSPIAMAPDWVIARLTKERSATAARVSPTSAPIPPGERNIKLTSLAGKLRCSGLGADAIEAALVVHNQQHCNPPLPENEVRNIARSISKYEASTDPVMATGAALMLTDMPEEALDGLLGEICSRRMEGFPRAYAYPALLAVASVLIPRCSTIRTNLFTGLVGPPHSGKTAANKRAMELLDLPAPLLLNLMSGSAEGLVAEVATAAGEARLYCPDEIGHMLEKLKIENASFPYILNRGFNEDQFKLRVARQRELEFHCRLSIIGGIVEDQFSDLFGCATVGGLWDRFLFGLCPTGFSFDYFPFNGIPALRRGVDPEPVAVTVDKNVWQAKSQWLKDDPALNPRVAELALRVAVICASFDGRQTLRASDLGPALAFARYQTSVRAVLRPNPGKTLDAQLAHKILENLRRVPTGQWVNQRDLLRAVHADRFGPGQVERTLAALLYNNDVERQLDGRKRLIRLAGDEGAPEPGKDIAVEI